MDLLAALLWPPRCCACAAPLAPDPAAPAAFCAGCAVDLRRPETPCPRCAAPLERPGAPCLHCQRERPRFERLRAACLYEGPVPRALHRLKWEGRDDLARPLGSLLAPVLRESAGRCDVLVPVPLHPARLRRRGYNQALLLGRAARRLAGVGLPLWPCALARLRDDPPAMLASAAGRAQQAAGAFAVAAGYGPRLRGRRVLLLDDVATTLATSSACAAALTDAGAAAVEVLTLARAAS